MITIHPLGRYFCVYVAGKPLMTFATRAAAEEFAS